jgi:hypothetical protein
MQPVYTIKIKVGVGGFLGKNVKEDCKTINDEPWFIHQVKPV